MTVKQLSVEEYLIVCGNSIFDVELVVTDSEGGGHVLLDER